MKKTTTLLAASAAVAVMLMTGCASNLATKPSTAHVVQIVGSGKKLGLVQDPATQQYSLGYQSVMVAVVTTPITVYRDTNGVTKYASPNQITRYEVAAKPWFFGAGGSTLTTAVGDTACTQLLAAASPPINEQIWPMNTNTPTTLPSVGTITPTTTSTSGSNTTQTAILQAVPGIK